MKRTRGGRCKGRNDALGWRSAALEVGGGKRLAKGERQKKERYKVQGTGYKVKNNGT